MNNSNITWRKEWIVSRYESPWGILQKFKYANAANDLEVYIFFGTLKGKYNRISKRNRDLYKMEGLDNHSLKKFLRSDIKKINQYNINQFREILNNSYKIDHFLRNDVHYCPKCLQNGFHSIFHQMTFFHKCVYHNVSLLSSCPICGSSIPYC